MSIGRRMWSLVLVGGLLLASTVDAAASSHAAGATTRYASPHGGSTGACSRRHPCEIGRAFAVAKSGDTVVILAGRYGSASAPVPDFSINDSDVLTIRGEAGKPAPVIYTDQATRIDAPDGSTLSHLEIHHSGSSQAFFVGIGAVADHVYVVTGPGSPQACLVFGGTLVDSTCFAQGPDGVAVAADDYDATPTTIALNGVDAIASGDGGIAVHGDAAYGSDLTINIVNTIMEGAEADLYYGASDIVDSTTVNVDHSDYATVETDPTGDGSQAVHATHIVAARPKLRDVLGGDFRERPNSPTVDAGTAKSAPRTDLLGNQRTAGRTTDIGAYEFQPAPALKHPHLTKARGGVRVSIRINPGRLATTVRLIAVHGRHKTSSKPKSAGSGSSYRRVKLALSTLKGKTKYRVYVRATSAGGSDKTKPVAIKTR